MFLSMTGFGRAERVFSWGTVVFELTSTNHKYQDFSVKFPREMLSLENEMSILMRNTINRGKVRLSAEISWNPGARIPILDEKSLSILFRQIKTLSIKNNLKAPEDLTNFLLIPGILDLNESSDKIIGDEKPEVWNEFYNEALKSLMDMKKFEGEKLFNAVLTDIKFFEKVLSSLSKRWEASKNDAIESLRTRIETVMQNYNLEIDEARIAQEVSLLSDKWDVTEELARLKSHCEKFRQTMNLNEPVGKKIDFLLQEMNREVNTMGSKVNDADFRWGVVEAKSCIERIREQIQNIE